MRTPVIFGNWKMYTNREEAIGLAKGIAECEQILQTKLHYLDRLIEIDLVLPASMCTPQHEAGIGRLKQGASDLDYVGTVNIYFVS